MNFYLIALRLIHVFSGVFWVGGAAIYILFITTAAKTAGPSGENFMQALVVRHRFPKVMTIASLLTILAGFLLYWNDSSGFQLSWITTGVGLGFTIGALAGVSAFLVGNLGIGLTIEKMAALGAAIGSNSPTPTQAAQLAVLQKRLHWAELADFSLLFIALLGMATARYWWF